MAENEEYLGDGLYASFEHDWLTGGMIKLRAPRGPEDHWVGLEADVFANLLEYAERIGWRALIDKQRRK